MVSEESLARKQFQGRMNNRTRKHGNFRQTLIDCAFQCVQCAETSELEFHAPDGHGPGGQLETGWWKGKAPMDSKRILLCAQCHCDEHGGSQMRFIGMHLVDQSRLIPDILAEIDKWGGYQGWLHAFKLDNSRLGIALPEVDKLGDHSKEARISFALSLVDGTELPPSL